MLRFSFFLLTAQSVEKQKKDMTKAAEILDTVNDVLQVLLAHSEGPAAAVSTCASRWWHVRSIIKKTPGESASRQGGVPERPPILGRARHDRAGFQNVSPDSGERACPLPPPGGGLDPVS